MRLYLAALYTSHFHKGTGSFNRMNAPEQARYAEIKHFLESYHYIHRQAMVDKIRADGTRVFLDSGAFSAFTKGVDLDINEYVAYIKRNKDIIDEVDGSLLASVLDGIGDPLKTYQNQVHMEKHGVRPLPCFHYGEDERYLEHYIANYDYITLGGMVPIPNNQLYAWLDRIWDKYLTTPAGHAKLKVHGFGMTSAPLMVRYPWFSVDSSSWVQVSANGYVFLPEYGAVPISNNHPARKMAGMHFDTMTPPQREALRKKIEAYGFEVKRLQEEYPSRWIFCCTTYRSLVENFSSDRFRRTQPELF